MTEFVTGQTIYIAIPKQIMEPNTGNICQVNGYEAVILLKYENYNKFFTKEFGYWANRRRFNKDNCGHYVCVDISEGISKANAVWWIDPRLMTLECSNIQRGKKILRQSASCFLEDFRLTKEYAENLLK
jgi:hypothetical protein